MSDETSREEKDQAAHMLSAVDQLMSDLDSDDPEIVADAESRVVELAEHFNAKEKKVMLFGVARLCEVAIKKGINPFDDDGNVDFETFDIQEMMDE